MNRMNVYFYLLIALCVGVVGGVVVFVVVLPMGYCSATVVKTVLSQDNTRKMVVFQTGCGATTELYSHVGVFSPEKEISTDDAGNVTVLVEAAALDAAWVNPKTLLVTYGGSDVKVLKQERKIEDIQVQYQIH
ncbi:MAG: hypothetical protein OEV94_07390 [Deltaproteobacteria bacterium]|nr:hypothetical protein [Deltaproteobacteria bacterium]